MDGQPRVPDRRTLICGVVAAGALCVGWFLPSTYADDGDDPGSSVIPIEQHVGDLEQSQ
ncbi:hypothetical protein [Streptomyces sp. PT12]|uniref:hypothetical protein n=1 Tax=Streptomyces sp. PT12 TaxID=1510197 RepID=UPI0015EFD24B|nr:hypothetical protein [Streptomyces sp. PT12]